MMDLLSEEGGYWCISRSSALGGTCAHVLYTEKANKNWVSYATRCYGRTIRAVRVTTATNTAIADYRVEPKNTTRKVLENGTIYIVRSNGEKYTIDGRKVE